MTMGKKSVVEQLPGIQYSLSEIILTHGNREYVLGGGFSCNDLILVRDELYRVIEKVMQISWAVMQIQDAKLDRHSKAIVDNEERE